jgi:hypothetical protein
MKAEQTDHEIDRSGWRAGPWDSEPDRVEWRASGFPCLAVRNHIGAWCGYVELPPGHPLHGAGYDAANGRLEDGVHGGLTYAGACSGPVCHVPAPGESEDVWWLGFDCCHVGDNFPGRADPVWSFANEFVSAFGLAQTRARAGEYRDLSFVRSEVESLAGQLSRLADP